MKGLHSGEVHWPTTIIIWFLGFVPLLYFVFLGIRKLCISLSAHLGDVGSFLVILHCWLALRFAARQLRRKSAQRKNGSGNGGYCSDCDFAASTGQFCLFCGEKFD